MRGEGRVRRGNQCEGLDEWNFSRQEKVSPTHRSLASTPKFWMYIIFSFSSYDGWKKPYVAGKYIFTNHILINTSCENKNGNFQ